MTDELQRGGVSVAKGDTGADHSHTHIDNRSTVTSTVDDHSQQTTVHIDNSSRSSSDDHSNTVHDHRKYRRSSIQIGGVAVSSFSLVIVASMVIVAVVAVVAIVTMAPPRSEARGVTDAPPVPELGASPTERRFPVAGMVEIPEGRVFPEGGTAAIVVERTFLMDETEVTVGQFRRFVESHPEWRIRNGNGIEPGVEESLPVTYVTWEAAVAFCGAAGKRLPTTGEWQYAARAGAPGPYWWGRAFDPSRAHFGGSGPLPVGGQLRRNQFGVYDTVGNVWEWTASEAPGGRRAVVGGGWEVPASPEAEAFHRVDTVQWIVPASAASDRGFRCVRDHGERS